MNIRFSGFGGQGIVLAGVIYGRAATIDGKRAAQTQSYGSSARGGASKSDVVISDTAIYELEATEIDVLVAMSQEAFTAHIHQLKKSGILITEKDLVQAADIKSKSYSVSVTRMAESLGLKIMANMVMLGYMSAVVPIVSKDAVCEAIRESVPKGTEKKNIEAFEKGYQSGSAASSTNPRTS
jgi:2-oxoglutarate ferredoxin oxidoreductase subunit gamma